MAALSGVDTIREVATRLLSRQQLRMFGRGFLN